MNEDLPPDHPDQRFHRRFIALLALLLIVAALSYIFAITFGKVPEDNVRFADTVLGFVMGTVLATPIGFYFGASKVQQSQPPSPATTTVAAPGTSAVTVSPSKETSNEPRTTT